MRKTITTKNADTAPHSQPPLASLPPVLDVSVQQTDHSLPPLNTGTETFLRSIFPESDVNQLPPDSIPSSSAPSAAAPQKPYFRQLNAEKIGETPDGQGIYNPLTLPDDDLRRLVGRTANKANESAKKIEELEQKLSASQTELAAAKQFINQQTLVLNNLSIKVNKFEGYFKRKQTTPSSQQKKLQNTHDVMGSTNVDYFSFLPPQISHNSLDSSTLPIQPPLLSPPMGQPFNSQPHSHFHFQPHQQLTPPSSQLQGVQLLKNPVRKDFSLNPLLHSHSSDGHPPSNPASNQAGQSSPRSSAPGFRR